MLVMAGMPSRSGNAQQRGELERKGAFTLIELLVVIAIIALLVSILVPALGTAREMARSTVCKSQLKTIGTSCHLYGSDYSGLWPQAMNYVPGYTPPSTSPNSWAVGLSRGGYLGAVPKETDWSALVAPPVTYCPSTRDRFGAALRAPLNGPTYYFTTQRYDGGRQTFPKGGWLIRRAGLLTNADEYVNACTTPRKTEQMLSDSVVLYECIMQENGSPYTSYVWYAYKAASGGFRYCHLNNANLLFADTHVQMIDFATAYTCLNWDWQIGAPYTSPDTRPFQN